MRSVNTRFWDDSFIQDLSTEDKLLFLYLLTNPLTSLLGIYETTIKRIVFDTGLEKETVLKGLERFEKVGKAFYRNNHIILPNFLKNQNLNTNMKKGVVKIFDDLPNELKVSILGNGSQSVSNDYQSILNGMLKYEREIESEIQKEGEGELNPPAPSNFKKDPFECDIQARRNFYNQQLINCNYDSGYYRFIENLFNEFRDKNKTNFFNEPMRVCLAFTDQVSFRQYQDLIKKADPMKIIKKAEAINSHYSGVGHLPQKQHLAVTIENWIDD